MLSHKAKYLVFILLRYTPLCPLSGKCFYHKQMLNFIKSFLCIYWNDNFLFFNLLMWYITLIDLQILKNSCRPGINPTWLWCMILFMYCWIWFTSTLLRTFASCPSVIMAYNYCVHVCDIFVWFWNQGDVGFI